MTAVPAFVAAEQDWPRLRVHRNQRLWVWEVTCPGGTLLAVGTSPSWAVALFVGTAALDQASAAWPAGADHSEGSRRPAPTGP